MPDPWERLFEFVQDGLLVYAWEERRILQANAGLARLLGYPGPAHEMVGHDLDDFLDEQGVLRELRGELERQGVVRGREVNYRTRAGVACSVLVSAYLLRDPDGVGRVMEAVVRDVTDLRIADAARRDSESLLQRVTRALPHGMVFVLDRDYRYVLSEGEELGRLGQDPGWRVGRTVDEVLGTDLGAAVRARLAPVFQGAETTYELRAWDREWMVHAAPLGPAGSPSDRVVLLSVNVTEANRLRRLHDASLATTSEGYALLDADTLGFLDVNDALCRMAGRDRAQMLALAVPDIVDGETPAGIGARTADLMRQGGGRLEFRLARPGAAPLAGEVALSPLPGEGRLVAFVRDVTQQHRARQELALRNRLLAAFLRPDLEQVYDGVMRAFLEATGSALGLLTLMEPDGTLTAPWLSPDVLAGCRMDHPPRWPHRVWQASEALWARVLRQRTPLLHNTAGRVPEGHLPILRSMAVPLLHGDTLLGMVQVANADRDYTAEDLDLLAATVAGIAPVLDARLAQARAAEGLRRSEERFRDMAQASGDWLWEADCEGRFTYCSPQVRELTGHAPEELLGRPLADLFSPELRAQVGPGLKRFLAGPGHIRDADSWLVTRDGRRVLMSSTAVVVRDAEGQPAAIRGLCRDITEKRRMEAEALRFQKLDSLGVLAGGIAHDFNNILTAVLGNVSLARGELPGAGEAQARLADAERALIRAQDLTRQLLTFSRGGAPVRRLSSLASVVAESAAFVLSGSNVRPSIHAPEDLWSAEVDPGQISQVVQNLVLNAVQAMPGGGVVRVSVDNVILGAERILPLTPGRYVQIDVQDEGVGIPEDLAERIFEPYFSTKARGSGLGLSVSYSIVRNHQGHLWFESVPGLGTTFHVALPASDRRAEPEPARSVGSGWRRGRVLVMDDEPMVRDVLVAMLKAGGFEAVATADGAEALAAWREARGAGRPFDAVLLDLTVPGGLGGQETLDRMRHEDPSVRAIVSSGYSTGTAMSDFRNSGFRGVIAKPFRPADLHRVVEQVLAEEG